MLKKDNSENKCIVKKVETKTEVLENTLKQNKEHTNRQIEQITQENLKLEKEINIIKKKSLSDKADHDKAVKAVEDKCNKLVKDALAKQKVAEKEMIETLKKYKEELGNYSMFHNKMSNENPKENESPIQNQEHKNKTKVSKAKLLEAKEEKVIKEFEKDSKIFFDLRMNCGLDVKSSKCRKCDYESHSEETTQRKGPPD